MEVFLNNKYEVLETRSKLYYRGNINISWAYLHQCLDNGNFPNSIRGNFSFVWVDGEDCVAAVDHFSTFPIYYSKNHLASNYKLISEKQSVLSENIEAQITKQFMGGYCLGEETIHNEIKRLQPGHYLKNGRQIKYIHLEDYIEQKHTSSESFKSLLGEYFLKNICEKNALLFSGGVDSLTLVNSLREQGLLDRFRLIFLHTAHQPNPEVKKLINIQDHLGLKIFITDLTSSYPFALSDETKSNCFSLYYDHTFAVKRIGIQSNHMEDHKIFTGELGDQLFGGKFINHCVPIVLQNPKLTSVDIAKLYINMATRITSTCTEPSGTCRNILDSQELGEIVYKKIILKIVDTLDLCRSDDLVKKLIFLDMSLKSSYILTPYSQDSIEYSHPYSSWQMVECALGLSNANLIDKGGNLKYLLKTTWDKSVPAFLWDSSKKGIGVPDAKWLRS